MAALRAEHCGKAKLCTQDAGMKRAPTDVPPRPFEEGKNYLLRIVVQSRSFSNFMIEPV